MEKSFAWSLNVLGFCLILQGGMPAQEGKPPKSQVDFNRQVRPILSQKCFVCHGPDESSREADLRLDQRESAIENGALVPRSPDQSEMIRRIDRDDDERMPPPDSDLSLTEQEKKILRQWVTEGGRYSRHWAFVKPIRPHLPDIDSLLKTKFFGTTQPVGGDRIDSHKVSTVGELKRWSRNEIDRFVLNRLLESGKRPARTADRYSLIRRVYLDLTGLPPTPEEADAFVRSREPDAYEKMVDRLLDSEAYGERWARLWLDLARYADTNGYEKDRNRSIWPYRDWVIRAINTDMPFDRFSIEQLAGDMLANATQEQFIATGFHRNTMLNEEGGIDPLEYRYYAMVDRVATTGTVWMGLSTGCAQCHSHKYDPISHTDYFRMFALLNNADEPDLTLVEKSQELARRQILDKIRTIEKGLYGEFPPDEGEGDESQRRQRNFDKHFQVWLKEKSSQCLDWETIRPGRMKTNLPKLSIEEDGSIFASGDFTKRDVYELKFELDENELPITAVRLEVLPDDRLPAGGPGNCYYEGRKGDFFLSELELMVDGVKQEFASGKHSYGKISIGSGKALAENVFDGRGSTGWSTAHREGERHQLILKLAKPLKSGNFKIQMIFERHFVASLGRFRLSVSRSKVSDPQPEVLPFENAVLDALCKNADQRSEQQWQSLRNEFLRRTHLLRKQQAQMIQLKKRLPSPVTTPVMREREANHPRPTHRRHRGEYLSSRELVDPALPELFQQSGRAKVNDRLEFARWLASKENPLVARVEVNRNWQAFFGRGLVRSPGDFGTQSEPPSHPQLLDWLAVEFQEKGWSRKELHRLIVTSATYRQSATVGQNEYREDPQNEALARGPRFRVEAEMIRDILLAASGKLSRKMYGPGVFPPQLASVTALSYGAMKWKESVGEDRYRRSLYTFQKRTAPFAAYMAFDATSGENCQARRNRSNTPLQALTLLNDAMFLEFADSLTALALKQKGKDDRATAQFLFRRLVTRPAQSKEITMIVNYLERQRNRLEKGEIDAKALGLSQPGNEFAAWFLVARALMNMDEVIVKP